MPEPKHSPISYRADEPIRMDELWFSFLSDANNNIVARIEGETEDQCRANAALIVKAVNNHEKYEKLAVACEPVKKFWEQLPEHFKIEAGQGGSMPQAISFSFNALGQIYQALADIDKGE
jgi:hypothetical protein